MAPQPGFYWLDGYYPLDYPVRELAYVYYKSEKTTRNRIRFFEASGTYERTTIASGYEFTAAQWEWLSGYSQRNPLAYLDEVQTEFKRVFHISISKTTVWSIISEHGLTFKGLVRRAMYSKEQDIFRFVEGSGQIDRSHQKLVFLDEVSFNNRGMIRKMGYSLAVRGDFQRKPRVSILAFNSARGLFGYYDTYGHWTEKGLGKAVVPLPSVSEEMFVNIQAQTLLGFFMAPLLTDTQRLCTTWEALLSSQFSFRPTVHSTIRLSTRCQARRPSCRYSSVRIRWPVVSIALGLRRVILVGGLASIFPPVRSPSHSIGIWSHYQKSYFIDFYRSIDLREIVLGWFKRPGLTIVRRTQYHLITKLLTNIETIVLWLHG